MAESVSFKFKWVNDQGQPEGFLAKKGSFDGETLLLDEAEVPAAAVIESEVRSNRLILSVATQEDEPVLLVVAIVQGSAKDLKDILGRARSRAWAAARREEMTAEGRGAEFREETCPNCNATIDLTGMPPTPQISCDFCNTISTLDSAEGVHLHQDLRLCDHCGMYSKPREFTRFYFYFLLVVYGYWSDKTWRCPGCMRGEAWKMLGGNLLFLLGIPVALVQLFRSYGGTDIGGAYAGLDSANIKARKGDLRGAINAYENILAKQPVSAGLKYNIALAFLQQDDIKNATHTLEYALKDCANYQPAASVLATCYEQAGEGSKLATLRKQWGVESPDESEAAPKSLPPDTPPTETLSSATPSTTSAVAPAPVSSQHQARDLDFSQVLLFGAEEIDDGVAYLPDWRASMVREFGKQIEPQLDATYEICERIAAQPRSRWHDLVQAASR